MATGDFTGANAGDAITSDFISPGMTPSGSLPDLRSDTLTVTAGGNDSVYGGKGDDVVFVSLNGADHYVLQGGGVDFIDFSGGSQNVNGVILDLTFGNSSVHMTISGFENVVGRANNDSFVGTTGQNLLERLFGMTLRSPTPMWQRIRPLSWAARGRAICISRW